MLQRIVITALLLVLLTETTAETSDDGDELIVEEAPVEKKTKKAKAENGPAAEPPQATNAGDAEYYASLAKTKIGAHIKKGMQFLDNHRPKAALKEFEKALQIDPKNGLAHFSKGKALERRAAADTKDTSRLVEALDSYSMAANLSPKQVDPYLNRGIMLNKLGHDEEAVETWERASAVSLPGDTRGLVNIALMHDKKGRTTEAIEVFKKATNMMIRDGDDYGNLGTAFAMMAAAYEKMLQYEDAMNAWTQAGNFDPKQFPGQKTQETISKLVAKKVKFEYETEDAKKRLEERKKIEI